LAKNNSQQKQPVTGPMHTFCCFLIMDLHRGAFYRVQIVLFSGAFVYTVMESRFFCSRMESERRERPGNICQRIRSSFFYAL